MPPGVPLTDDPDLHLLVDGARMDAVTRTDGVHVFAIQDAPAMRIVSHAAVPQELGLARDPRGLGVAVQRIVVRQGTRFRVVQTDDPRLTDGFHASEPDQPLRWTNGDAALPLETFAGFIGAFEVVVQVGATARYIDRVSAACRAA